MAVKKVSGDPTSARPKSFYPIFRGMFFGLVFAGLFSAVLYVFAQPPDRVYNFSETLNPTCTPGSTNCTVQSPAAYSFGSNNFSGTGTFTTTGIITAPRLIGGSATTSDLNLQTTSGVGTTGADMHFFVGNNGATEAMTILNSGNIGIATTTSPTNILSFGGDVARTIWMERNTTTSGSNLTLQAGGGLSGGTNLSGGSLYLAAGIATGSGSSDMFFQTATEGASGTSDVTPTTKFTVRGTGNVVVGTGTALATTATSGFLYIPSSAGAPTGTPVVDTIGTVPIQYDTTNNRLYVYRGDAWHYIAETAGFQIPDFETTDPISGEQMKEGDIVLGRIDKTMSDDALHAAWVSWNSIKAQLLAEARGELSKTTGAWGTGAVEGVETETFLDKVKNTLFSLGISVKDGVTQITQLSVERLSAKNTRVETLEMVDKATGDIYCTWIADGEWQKIKGDCSSSAVVTAVTSQPVAANAIAQSVLQAQEIVQQAQQAAEQAQQAAGQAQQAAEQVQEQAPAPTPETTAPVPIETLAPVEQQPEEQSAPAPSTGSGQAEQPSAGDIIQEAAAGLLQSMWEFTKWIFGTSFEEVSKLVPNNVKELSAGLMQKANDFIKNIINTDFQIISSGIKIMGAVLSEPIQKIFGK